MPINSYLVIGHHQTTWLMLSGFQNFPIVQTQTMDCTRSQGPITRESDCHQLLKSQISVEASISSLSLGLLSHENGPPQLSLMNALHSL